MATQTATVINRINPTPPLLQRRRRTQAGTNGLPHGHAQAHQPDDLARENKHRQRHNIGSEIQQFGVGAVACTMFRPRS